MAYENLGKAIDRVAKLLPSMEVGNMSREQRDDLEAMLYALDAAALELREHLQTEGPVDPNPGYNLTHRLHRDGNGYPSGGRIMGKQFTVYLQQGPRGQGSARAKPDGANVDTFLKAAQLLLNHYQTTHTRSEHNDLALRHIDAALDEMSRRRADRAKRGIWGLNAE